MSIRAQIKNAVGNHGKWKNELKKAIETGKIDVQISSIQADDQCSFGKWLHGPVITEQEKKSAYYDEVRQLHAAFHKAAAKCAQLALAGKKDGARRMLEPTGEFTVASAALTSCMLSWLIEADKQS